MFNWKKVIINDKKGVRRYPTTNHNVKAVYKKTRRLKKKSFSSFSNPKVRERGSSRFTASWNGGVSIKVEKYRTDFYLQVGGYSILKRFLVKLLLTLSSRGYALDTTNFSIDMRGLISYSGDEEDYPLDGDLDKPRNVKFRGLSSSYSRFNSSIDDMADTMIAKSFSKFFSVDDVDEGSIPSGGVTGSSTSYDSNSTMSDIGIVKSFLYVPTSWNVSVRKGRIGALRDFSFLSVFFYQCFMKNPDEMIKFIDSVRRKKLYYFHKPSKKNCLGTALKMSLFGSYTEAMEYFSDKKLKNTFNRNVSTLNKAMVNYLYEGDSKLLKANEILSEDIYDAVVCLAKLNTHRILFRERNVNIYFLDSQDAEAPVFELRRVVRNPSFEYISILIINKSHALPLLPKKSFRRSYYLPNFFFKWTLIPKTKGRISQSPLKEKDIPYEDLFKTPAFRSDNTGYFYYDLETFNDFGYYLNMMESDKKSKLRQAKFRELSEGRDYFSITTGKTIPFTMQVVIDSFEINMTEDVYYEIDKEPPQSLPKNCIGRIFDVLVKKGKLKKENYFFAHNGAGFDTRHIFNWLISVLIDPYDAWRVIYDDMIFKSSSMTSLSFYIVYNRTRRKIIFRDTIYFAPGSLSSLAKGLSMKEQKLTMAYEDITSYNDVLSKGMEKEIEKYSIRDVIVLRKIYNFFTHQYFFKFGRDVREFATVSSLSRDLLYSDYYPKKEKRYCPPLMLEMKYKNMLFGGNTQSWVRGKLKEPWTYIDFTSLYPSVIVYLILVYNEVGKRVGLPAGKGKEVLFTEFMPDLDFNAPKEKILEILNHSSYYLLEIEYQHNSYDLGYHKPLFPLKKDGANVYPIVLNHWEKHLIEKEILIEIVKEGGYGMKFRPGKHAIVYPDTTFSYSKMAEDIAKNKFEMDEKKRTAKNDDEKGLYQTLRNVFKLVMNSQYGISILNVINSTMMTLKSDTSGRLEDTLISILDAEVTQFGSTESGIKLISVKNFINIEKRDLFIGIIITQRARFALHNLDARVQIELTKYYDKNIMFGIYSDTDSLQIRARDDDVKRLILDKDYLFKRSDKGLGGVTLETPLSDGANDEIIEITAKIYAFRTASDGVWHIKFKGFSQMSLFTGKRVEKHSFTYVDYLGEDVSVENADVLVLENPLSGGYIEKYKLETFRVTGDDMEKISDGTYAGLMIKSTLFNRSMQMMRRNPSTGGFIRVSKSVFLSCVNRHLAPYAKDERNPSLTLMRPLVLRGDNRWEGNRKKIKRE